NIKKKSWLDNKELLQTAISVLKDNQNLNGKMQYNKLTFLSFFHFNNILLHFSTTKQLEIWLK
ncbi:hypothetical protein H5Q64_25100, partial [Escherichia coli]|nr:hypothetical protein [Escherichia coli]